MSQESSTRATLGLNRQRRRIIQLLLIVGVALGPFGILPGVLRLLRGEGWGTTLPIYLLTYLAAVVLLLVRRIPDVWRALLLLGVVYGFAVFALYSGWLAGGGRIFLIAVITTAAVLLHPRAGFFAAGLAVVTYAAFALAFQQGWLVLRPLPDPTTTSPIVVEGVGFLIVIGMVIIALWFFEQALAAAARANEEILHARVLLEMRTVELERQAVELMVASEAAAAARREAEAANRALQAQMWQVASQAQLAETMRGEQDIPTLAAGVIRQVCQSLAAPVGTLYLLEGDLLVLAGSYAYTPTGAHSTSFHLGQGLLGQAARGGSAIVVDAVPADYLTVTSGIGRTAVQQILIAPFLYEGRVVGVIEVGTLARLDAPQVEFVNAALESIAVAFHTAQARAHIDKLLAQTQQQAQELQAQEEELRAVNEELQAQTDLLRLRQQSYRDHLPAGPSAQD